MGNVTPDRMVQLWMKSRSHRANILDRGWYHRRRRGAAQRTARGTAQVFPGY
jgi:uncharacterized protein YkwD